MMAAPQDYRVAEYQVPGTAVVRTDSVTGTPETVDIGAVVCNPTGQSIGGGCILWNPVDDSINVLDAAGDVAYQVCIDNDGNGYCQSNCCLPCGDDIFFSHGDGGEFFNPLGPLPTHFRFGCPGGFPGWVIFVCAGIHEDWTGAHTHSAGPGVILSTQGGQGIGGNFCETETPGKPYFWT
jgi:hypothetical protein